MSLTGMQIFKYLPAAKKSEGTNCKKCGCPTCMAFALKLAKQQISVEKCPFAPAELVEQCKECSKTQQHEIQLSKDCKVGGETVMFRHEKTFVNPAAIFVKLDPDSADFEKTFEKIRKYSIERVGETFKINGIYLTGENPGIEKEITGAGFALLKENDARIVRGANLQELACNSMNKINQGENQLLLMPEIKEFSVQKILETFTQIRRKAILDRYEPFTYPVIADLPHFDDVYKICALASMLICRYASIIVLDTFNEALLASLFTLRQNIYTNPQKPLQVESKVYEFNEPDENSVVLMTTNFALTYFAVAGELESMPFGSYLVVTPSDGMSVLTAWSADKFNAEIVAKMLKKVDLASKIKTRKIIIPGLLAHMKEELEEALPEWEIVVGTIEAFGLYDFIKNNALN